MAGSISLGSLGVTIGADTAPLFKGKKDVDRAARDIQKQFDSLSSRLQRTLFRVAPWATLSGAILGVGAALKSMLAETRQLEMLHQATGISIAELGKFRHAIEQAGGTLADLTTGAAAFNATVRQAIIEPTGAAAIALQQLGVSTRDAQGNITKFDDVAEKIAKRFAGWKDGADKASNAAILFGGAAGQMTLMLNKGERALQASKDEAAKYAINSEEGAKKSIEFKKAVDNLAASIQRMSEEGIQPALPFLTRFVDGLDKWLQKSWEHRSGLRASIPVIEDWANKVRVAREAVDAAQKAVDDNGGSTSNLANLWGRLGTNLDEAKAKLKAAEDGLAAATEAQLMANRAAAEANRLAAEKPKETKTNPEDSNLEAKARQKAIEAQLFQLDELKAHLDGLPNAWNEAFTINDTTFEQTKAKIDEIMKMKGLSIEQERTLARDALSLEKQKQDAMRSTASLAATALSTTFKNSKAAGIAAAIINTAVGITEAMKLQPPFSWVQASLVAAMGAAQIATIRSTSKDGGGSTPSGSPAGGASSGGAAAGPSRSMHVTGIDPSALYSGSMLQAIIGGINEAVQDGVTLISTKNLPV